jgi:hypothetical protein
MPHSVRRSDSLDQEHARRAGFAIAAALGVVLLAGLWLVLTGLL